MYVPFLPVNSCTKPGSQLKNYRSDNSILFFELGRQAMNVGIENLGLKNTDTVLMPSSLCSAVLEPFLKNGIKIDLYDLDKDMKCSINNIKDNITTTTKAIYVIHYFGIRNNLKTIKEFCNARDIFLIEDCALSGFSQSIANISYGDICVFSLWKFHAIPDGAILKVNTKKISSINYEYKKSPTLRIAIGRFKIKLKRLTMQGFLSLGILNLLRHQPDKGIDGLNGDLYSPLNAIKISNSSLNTFLMEDEEKIINIRRRNFYSLLNYCNKNKIETLYQCLDDNDIPYCFPIIVENSEQIKRALAEEGIETEISINEPPSIEIANYNNQNFDNIKKLSVHCLSIPIHQNINQHMMTYIKTNLSKIIKKNKSFKYGN